MTDDKDPPITPLDYVAGVTVINFGDVRVARGMSRRHHSSCPHIQLIYDQNERRIWCKDCERDVEPFDAFRQLAERASAVCAELRRREQEISEAEKFNIRTLAAKKIDEAWRSHKMVPSCPHCHHGLFPDDFKNGCGMVGKQFAARRIQRGHET